MAGTGKDIRLLYMRRCLELASGAQGYTASNPMVGSVIVYNGRIIGEGYHRKFGMPHAEVNAINSVKDRRLLKESTIYVNLEPCSHYGKTPPCAGLIIKTGIPHVVIGTKDPNPKVAGRGIKMMQDAGIKVETGFLEEDCRFLNRRFFTFQEKKRPYIILKWAQSADGFIDIDRSSSPGDGPNWITGERERMLVHKWRSQEQAILVGTNTARIDDPGLDVRHWEGNDPLRFLIDMDLKLGMDLKLLNGELPTVVINEFKEETIGKLKFVRTERGTQFWRQIMEIMHGMGLASLFVEGGAITINSLLKEGLWDEARVFTGKQNFYKGIKAPVPAGRNSRFIKTSGQGLRITYR